MSIQNKVDLKLDELIENNKDYYTHFFVGTDTQGISFKEFKGKSWSEILNKMLDLNYINIDDVDDISLVTTEEECLDCILDCSDAYYYRTEKISNNQRNTDFANNN